MVNAMQVEPLSGPASAKPGPGGEPAGSTRPARGRRQTRIGRVTTSARQKTIRLEVAYTVQHAKYGKLMRRRTVLHAHDENNECREGDIVEVVQCRPLSKTKRWRLLRVVQRGHAKPEGAAQA
jgi:small subunit ribosomal protein S17